MCEECRGDVCKMPEDASVRGVKKMSSWVLGKALCFLCASAMLIGSESECEKMPHNSGGCALTTALLVCFDHGTP